MNIIANPLQGRVQQGHFTLECGHTSFEISLKINV